MPYDCPSQRCGVRSVCWESVCTDIECIGLVCPVEEACANGSCFPLGCGDGGVCGKGQVCVAGACAGAACAGIACPGGQSCVNGLCVAEVCDGGVACPPGEFCDVHGCAEPDCVGVICPGALRCVRGLCTDCEVGSYPSPVDGACIPTRDGGAPCSAGHQCASRACVEGVCCNGSCGETCTTCVSGTCLPRPDGTPDGRCGAFVCGAAAQCETSCSVDGDCAPGAVCNAGGNCLPPAPIGAPCDRDGECQSGFCRDGRCCASNCGGACATCAAPGALGQCTPLPAATPCRDATATGCDVAEVCNGSQLACPADGFRPAGSSCGQDDVGPWGACVLEANCSGTGTRSRTVTSFSCGEGECVATSRTETEACTVSVVGAPCGTAQVSAWSTCAWASTCDTSGKKTRTITRPTCTAAGTCGNPVTTTETASCTRSTNGLSCGVDQPGTWSSCGGYGSTCDETGKRTRTVKRFTCAGGACTSSTFTQTDSCTRNTDGWACGTTQSGSCVRTKPCPPIGYRNVTSYTCKAGQCVGTTTQNFCQPPCPLNCPDDTCL